MSGLSGVQVCLHAAVFLPAAVLSPFLTRPVLFPACLTDNAPERPLKALLALIAISLRSNMPLLIVLKCNQGLHSEGANNLNLTKRLRLAFSRPAQLLPKRNKCIYTCGEKKGDCGHSYC